VVTCGSIPTTGHHTASGNKQRGDLRLDPDHRSPHNKRQHTAW
jgi:hypothetical protein